MTLLEKAKAVEVKKNAGPSLRDRREVVELAVAYANREITTPQAAAALGCKANSISGILSGSLLMAIRRGEYRLVKVEEPDAPHTL